MCEVTLSGPANRLVPIRSVRSCAARENIVTRAAVQSIIIVATIQCVISRAPEKGVVTISP